MLPTQARPPKRTFDEVDENEAEEPNSDEAYGWIEDDGIATEELPVDNAVINVDVVVQRETAAEGRHLKMARTSTV